MMCAFSVFFILSVSFDLLLRFGSSLSNDHLSTKWIFYEPRPPTLSLCQSALICSDEYNKASRRAKSFPCARWPITKGGRGELHSAMQNDGKELIEFKKDEKTHSLRHEDNLKRDEAGWWRGAEDEKALLARIVLVERSDLNSCR